MNSLKYISAFSQPGKVAATTTMMIALACGAYGQSEPKVPFDLEKFQPVLSDSRLHSPRTRNPIAVRRGEFDGYELPGRFYLGESGTTMVLATTRRDRDRSEIRHNTWPVTEGAIHYSARLRLDALVPEGEGWKRRRLNFLQIYVPGIPLGPVVLISVRHQWRGEQDQIKEDHLWVSVQRGGDHDLGPRPDDFFDLDVHVRDGELRVYMNNELKVVDSLASFAGRRAFFKTGAYHRGIEPHAVEFERLTITTP